MASRGVIAVVSAGVLALGLAAALFLNKRRASNKRDDDIGKVLAAATPQVDQLEQTSDSGVVSRDQVIEILTQLRDAAGKARDAIKSTLSQVQQSSREGVVQTPEGAVQKIVAALKPLEHARERIKRDYGVGDMGMQQAIQRFAQDDQVRALGQAVGAAQEEIQRCSSELMLVATASN